MSHITNTIGNDSLHSFSPTIFSLFPPQYLLTLPNSLLLLKKQCFYTHPTRTCNTTTPPTSLCFPPLTPSSFASPITLSQTFPGCNLKCTSGDKYYGLSHSQQGFVEGFKLGGSLLCLIILVFLCMNQVVEQRLSSVSFWSKPLLWHVPYCITAFSILLMLQFTVSVVIQKETIVCNSDNTVSFQNPGSKPNIGCTLQGIVFYIAMLGFANYTTLMTLAIWSQLANPFHYLWGVKKMFWHGGIAIYIVGLSIAAVLSNSIDAVFPMGVCVPGPPSRLKLILLLGVPTAICVVISSFCLVHSIYLLCRTVKRHEASQSLKKKNNKEMLTQPLVEKQYSRTSHLSSGYSEYLLEKSLDMKRSRDLLQRMSVYGAIVTIDLTLLTATVWKFVGQHDALRKSLAMFLRCTLVYGNENALCKRTNEMNPFWFISWIIVALGAVASQLVLSCHQLGEDDDEPEAIPMEEVGTNTLIQQQFGIADEKKVGGDRDEDERGDVLGPELTRKQTKSIAMTATTIVGGDRFSPSPRFDGPLSQVPPDNWEDESFGIGHVNRKTGDFGRNVDVKFL